MTHRLSTVIRGVEFEFLTPGGSRRRALVVATFLTSRYGCADRPDELLRAYERHRTELENEAVSVEAARPVGAVLIVA